jgi:RNA polymerase primary sigma factor
LEVNEMQELPEVQELIAAGAGTGRVSADSVAQSLGHLELQAQEVAAAYRRICDAGIRIEEDDVELPAGSKPGWVQAYVSRVERTPALSGKRERYLAELIQAGGMSEEVVARKLLLESNQKTAVRVANHYRDEGIDFGLLLGEANNGMVRALDSYDPTQEYSFGAWATWWAHRAIAGLLEDRFKAVQLPTDELDALNQVLRVRELLKQERVKEPSVVEIAGRMGIDPDRVGELMQLA